MVDASTQLVEPINACVSLPDSSLDRTMRERVSRCLGWVDVGDACLCRGFYRPIHIEPLFDEHEIQVKADRVVLSQNGTSRLSGDVEVRQSQRMVQAQTATIFRDPKTQSITRIEFVDHVRYIEPDRLMLARKATINPQDKSGVIEDVLYRFKTTRAHAVLPAWGRARWIQRYPNQDFLLKKATYSTCSPKGRAWEVDAEQIQIDKAKGRGVAKNAKLKLGSIPIIYTPYLSFPTTKERKSGFLMPLVGYSNLTGFDYAAPYYLNLAPNWDATVVPHAYSMRGVMLGGNTRFLTPHSTGVIGGNFLPKDAYFRNFLDSHQTAFPELMGVSTNRWSVMMHDTTRFLDNLVMNVSYQQVSDDYYLQDFSSNLAISTENQLLRQGDLSYATDHWLLKGMVQSYQTLHPINQSEVANIYARLPQLQAEGSYMDLPLHGEFDVLGQFDYFQWTGQNVLEAPQGARYHLNPILSLPQRQPWGYVTPSVQLVENQYQLSTPITSSSPAFNQSQSFNRTIPRFSVDSGLVFERQDHMFGHMLQTLEPRVYYLNVPYQNQSEFPSFDSAYMIFNTDQLFRDNRFSGFDRIGDANQLAYAATSRWISTNTGKEIASLTVGQLRYFSQRRVQLCFRPDGQCEDSPLFLGYVSPTATYSPVASKATYALTSKINASADYVWDPATSATNNGNLNLHYRPKPDRMLTLGYNYLVSGNVFALPEVGVQNNALHQITAGYGWPFNEKWSSLGVYSYNISKQYSMLTFFGIQYDSCCWAARLVGGRAFKSVGVDTLSPQYNNSVFFQVLLKGLGSVSNSDPASTIQSFLPGYPNIFGRS